MKRIAVLMTISFALLAFESSAMAASSGVTYQGRILKPNGSPLSGQFTQFKLQIRTPDSASCLMYEEIQSQDLRNSGGLFSLTINDGTGSRTDSTGLTLDRIFANRGSFTLDISTCSIGSGVYSPNVGDGRTLVVQFKDETMSTWEPIPPQKINYVPFAFEAKQVQGFSADSLLRVVNGSGDPLTGLAPLSNAQYNALLDLVNGSSSAYTRAGQLNGVALPTMNSGEVLGWNGSAWVSTTASGGPNSVTTAMIQNAAVDSSKIATGAVGSTQIANGAVGTSQIASNVSISTTGTLGSAITTTRDFKIYAASPSTFYVGMLADPTLAASYTLTWPLTAGSANQVLTTDGSGKLTWTSPSSAGITDLTGDVTATGPGSAAATVASVGGSTAALVHSAELAANAATSANTPNTIVKRDGSGNVSAGDITAANVKTDTLQLNNAGSVVNLVNPVGAAYTLTLPPNTGTSGQVLTTNGLGVTSWINALTSATGFVQGGNTFGVNADLGTNDGFDLNFRTAGTTKMTVTSGGLVGIGTTGPTTKLEVVGGDAFFNGVRVGRGGGDISSNTAVGLNALAANTTGVNNTAIGWDALAANTTTGYSTAIGQGALRSNTSTGLPSLAIGSGALYNNTTGDRNTAVGTFAMITSTTGVLNTAIGHRALQFATTGSNNTTIGYQGLEGVTTGNQNIGLGYRAGANITTGSKNLVIGYDISAPTATANNQLNIGNLIYGTGLDGTGSTISTGNVGIGTTSPATKLEVAGSLRVGDGGETCDAGHTGAIRYNGGNLQFCAGSMPWTTLGVAGSGISSLTGDVTATGSGAAAATVASVGGSSAALVHSAELAANAATSANTASMIVKRDASGNFSAGAISATSLTATGAVTQGSSVFKDSGSNTVTIQAPTSVSSSYILKWPTSAGGSDEVLKTDASGNLSWTSLPTALPPNGAAGGDLTGSYPNPTVATVGTSTAANIHSAELLANAATAVNTSNAIVKRDGTGNFAANVGTFNGVALNNAGSVVNLVNPVGAAYTLTLPTGTGTNGQVLMTNGSGTTSWLTALTSSNGFMQGGNSFGTIANLGTNDNYDLRFKANGTAVMAITPAGNVGIGTTAPYGILDVMSYGARAASGNGRGINLYAESAEVMNGNGGDIILAAGGAGVVSGSRGRIIMDGITVMGMTHSAATSQDMVTTDFVLNNVPAGTTTFIAHNLDVRNASSANAPTASMTGLKSTVWNYGKNYLNATAGQFNVTNNGFASATIAVAKAGDFSISGPQPNTNGYGVYIGTIAATNKFSLYANDSTAPSYFAGNVGIGTTSPLEKLQVNGGLRIGNTTGSNAGTLRWTGTNFQAYNGSAWQNLVVDLPASGACDTTQTYNVAGVNSYTVPASFATLTVQVWGGGGGGGDWYTTNGGSGGASSIASLGLNAGGGSGGSAGLNGGIKGNGGSASGGTTNTNGNSGSNAASPLSGAGGNAGGGGGTGGAAVTNTSGAPGGVPGGGGSGQSASGQGAGGGGGGGYTMKVFTPATLAPGTTISDIVVGAGGTGANNLGGAGGVGTVSITCSSTGLIPNNDKGIVFVSGGANTTTTTFIYDSGNVGIGTTSPQATLDVNGAVRLKVNSSQPVTCSSANSGTVALNSSFRFCVCNGTTSAWVYTTDGSTACAW